MIEAMEPTHICGHTYSRQLGKKTFICMAAPHPKRPDDHHFQAASPTTVQMKGHLVVVPGERRR